MPGTPQPLLIERRPSLIPSTKTSILHSIAVRDESCKQVKDAVRPLQGNDDLTRYIDDLSQHAHQKCKRGLVLILNHIERLPQDSEANIDNKKAAQAAYREIESLDIVAFFKEILITTEREIGEIGNIHNAITQSLAIHFGLILQNFQDGWLPLAFLKILINNIAACVSLIYEARVLVGGRAEIADIFPPELTAHITGAIGPVHSHPTAEDEQLLREVSRTLHIDEVPNSTGMSNAVLSENLTHPISPSLERILISTFSNGSTSYGAAASADDSKPDPSSSVSTPIVVDHPTVSHERPGSLAHESSPPEVTITTLSDVVTTGEAVPAIEDSRQDPDNSALASTAVEQGPSADVASKKPVFDLDVHDPLIDLPLAVDHPAAPQERPSSPPDEASLPKAPSRDSGRKSSFATYFFLCTAGIAAIAAGAHLAIPRRPTTESTVDTITQPESVTPVYTNEELPPPSPIPPIPETPAPQPREAATFSTFQTTGSSTIETTVFNALLDIRVRDALRRCVNDPAIDARYLAKGLSMPIANQIRAAGWRIVSNSSNQGLIITWTDNGLCNDFRVSRWVGSDAGNPSLIPPVLTITPIATATRSMHTIARDRKTWHPQAFPVESNPNQNLE